MRLDPRWHQAAWRLCTIILSALVARHRLALDRGTWEHLRQFEWPAFSPLTLAGGLRWLIAAVLAAALAWLIAANLRPTLKKEGSR